MWFETWILGKMVKNLITVFITDGGILNHRKRCSWAQTSTLNLIIEDRNYIER